MLFWFLPLFILGGFGMYGLQVAGLGLAFGLLFLFSLRIKTSRLKFPKYFSWYLTFLAVFALSLLWSTQLGISVQYLVLFASGGCFWLSAYNLQDSGKSAKYLVIDLALIFSLFFLIQNQRPLERNFLSLFSIATQNHNHIGDIWAIALIPVVFSIMTNKKRALSLLLGILGTYFVYISESRSAVVAIGAGTAYLFWKNGWIDKYRKPFVFLAGITVTLFIAMGMTKSTLFSRPYVLEGIVGLPKYPFGVGVGSFEKISSEFPLEMFGRNTFSIYAHSLPIEILVGLGVLSLIFFAWLIKVSEDLAYNSGKQTVLLQAMFFGLLGNFLFDTTYFIPTMLWLWFTLLGLAQAKE